MNTHQRVAACATVAGLCAASLLTGCASGPSGNPDITGANGSS